MKRSGLVLVALILAGAAGVAVVRGAGSFSPVYSVAELRAGLARHPGAWLGHTVLVRGVASGGWFPLMMRGGVGGSIVFYAGRGRPVPSTPPPPLRPSAMLADVSSTAPAAGLLIAFGGEDPLLAFLRRLPWIGRFAPRPQNLHWSGPAVYRVRPQAAPGSCGHTTCYEAVLLDAAPRAPLLFHVATVFAVATPLSVAVKPWPILEQPHHVGIPAPPAAP